VRDVFSLPKFPSLCSYVLFSESILYKYLLLSYLHFIPILITCFNYTFLLLYRHKTTDCCILKYFLFYFDTTPLHICIISFTCSQTAPYIALKFLSCNICYYIINISFAPRIVYIMCNTHSVCIKISLSSYIYYQMIYSCFLSIRNVSTPSTFSNLNINLLSGFCK
jgi:hypothetical protein